MTNTLHRAGPPASFQDDYIVFAMPARGLNDDADAPAKLRAFLACALGHRPVNVGNGVKGGLYHPSPSLTPGIHWHRLDERDPQAVLASIDSPSVVAAVFDNLAAVRACLADLKAADLGLSINVSGLTAPVQACAQQVGCPRHSVEYSLGFRGDLGQLPPPTVLALSSMCGHGMVSHALAQKMCDWVKEGRRSPAAAAATLARFCSCGIFNPTRAVRLLEAARDGER